MRRPHLRPRPSGRRLRGVPAAGTALAAVWLSACAAPEPATDRAVIRVSVRPYLTYAPLYVAEGRGFFADEGIDIEFVDIPSQSRAVPLLVQGELDVLPAPISPGVLTAIARGERVRYVADKGWVDPEGCDFLTFIGYRERFESRQGSGPGGTLRISRSQEPQFNFFLERVLDRTFGLSLDSDSIEAFNIPTSAEMIAFERGTLDAAFTASPHTEIATSQFGVEPMGRVMDALPGYQVSMIAFGPRLLDEEPDLGRRFMVGYVRGLQAYAEGHTSDNVRAISEATGIEEPLVEQACWIPVSPDGIAKIGTLADYVDWYVERGWLEERPDLGDLWDGTFVEHAGRVLAERNAKEDE